MAVNTRTCSDALAFVRSNEIGTVTVRTKLEGSLTASLTLSDIILIAKIPNKAMIHDFYMAGIVPGDATIFKVGTGGAGVTTGGDDTSVCSTVTLSGTAAIKNFDSADTMPYLVSLSDDAEPKWTWLFATLISGTSTATCSIQFVVKYSMPGAI